MGTSVDAQSGRRLPAVATLFRRNRVNTTSMAAFVEACAPIIIDIEFPHNYEGPATPEVHRAKQHLQERLEKVRSNLR